MVIRKVYMDYVEFVEFSSRYFKLAKQHFMPYIPYKPYKEIQNILKKYSVVETPFMQVMVETEEAHKMDTIYFRIDEEDRWDTVDFEEGNTAEDFIDTICDWATYGYSWDVEFVQAADWNECRSVWDGINKPVSKNNIKTETETEMKKQEEEIMKTNFNFEFGVIKSDDYRMSPYGMAVACHNTFKAFDKTTGNIVDVGDFTFKMDGAFFKMPIAVDAIKVGDMLMVNHDPMFVIDTKDGIKVVDIVHGEQKTVMPTTNIFGFNYMTKVVSMFDNMNLFSGMTAPSAEQPFGNMMPFMMMSSMCGDGGFGFDGDMGKMMMMSMMMSGQNPFAAMMGQMAPAAPVKPE